MNGRQGADSWRCWQRRGRWCQAGRWAGRPRLRAPLRILRAAGLCVAGQTHPGLRPARACVVVGAPLHPRNLQRRTARRAGPRGSQLGGMLNGSSYNQVPPSPASPRPELPSRRPGFPFNCLVFV